MAEFFKRNMEDQDALKQRIKAMMVENLMLQISPEEIADDQPLFGPGSVGLDSVDALQLVVALDKAYGLKIADPETHERPEFNVPTQDARWFRLCTLDGATVTTADGRGAVYRQRDRAKMFALLRQSLRRQRQLLRRFDEMRRVYREALPVLSSKEKWETVLLPAHDSAESNAAGNGRHHG